MGNRRFILVGRIGGCMGEWELRGREDGRCIGRIINRMIGGWEGVLRMERWIRIERWKEEMKDGICGRKTGRINERKEG